LEKKENNVTDAAMQVNSSASESSRIYRFTPRAAAQHEHCQYQTSDSMHKREWIMEMK